MNAKWIILKYGPDAEIARLVDAVEKSGREYRVLSHVPYEEDAIFDRNDCVVLNGPPFLVMDALRHRSWTPTAWLDMEQLSCRKYYGHWGKYIAQKNYTMLPLGEVARLEKYLYSAFGKDGCIFIRPDSNNKTFNGELVHESHFGEWYSMLNNCGKDLDLLCVVSEPVDISYEWRLIFRRGKYVTGSSYRRHGEIDYTVPVSNEAIRIGTELASKPFDGLPPIYVLDFARTLDGFKLLEIGSVNTAGYYGSDVSAIVEAMSQEAEKEWEDMACFRRTHA